MEFDAIDILSNEKQLAASLGSTNPIRTLPNLRKAKRVLSLDCDFLSPREANSLVNSRGFMAGRKVLNGDDAKKMNRLYSVESDLTITGGVADHRLRLSSTEIKGCASLLLSFILESRKKPDQQLIDHLKKVGEGCSYSFRLDRKLCKRSFIQAKKLRCSCRKSSASRNPCSYLCH